MVAWQTTNKPDVARNAGHSNLLRNFASTRTAADTNANLVIAFDGASGTQSMLNDFGTTRGEYMPSEMTKCSILRNGSANEMHSRALEMLKREPLFAPGTEINAPVAEKLKGISCISITSITMGITCESMCMAQAEAVCIDGLSPMDSHGHSNCFVPIAISAKRGMGEFVLIEKVQRLADNGVAPSGAKCTAPLVGDEIVCSAWQHAAVAESDEQEFANLAEHTGSSIRSPATPHSRIFDTPAAMRP